MYDVCVVAVDAARARFFHDRHEAPPARYGGPSDSDPSWAGHRLNELDVLIHPSGRMLDQEQLTETKPGTARGPAGAQAHAYSDHRDARRDELDRKFAAAVIVRAEELCGERDARRLLIVADPRMLGFLRQHVQRLERVSIDVRDLAKDLSRLHPDEIRKVLEKNDALPWSDE